MIVKAIPAIVAAIPLAIKLIKKLFENNKNTKSIFRSIGLSILVLVLALMLLIFIMFIIYSVDNNIKSDKVNKYTSLCFTMFAYLTLISSAIKLNYKSKHTYTIAASSKAVKKQNDYNLKNMDEQLTIISNRIIKGDCKVNGRLDFVENLDYAKETKEVIIFRWLSIFSWLVIPCSSIILIFNLNGTEYNVWYVNLSILFLAIVINSLFIYPDVQLQEGKTTLTIRSGHKHVKQYRKKIKKQKKR